MRVNRSKFIMSDPADCVCGLGALRRGKTATHCGAHNVLCGACGAPTAATDRYDRCLDCAEGLTGKRKVPFRTDDQIERATRKRLGLEPLPTKPTRATVQSAVEEIVEAANAGDERVTVVASDIFGTTYRIERTGYELTVYTEAGKVIALTREYDPEHAERLGYRQVAHGNPWKGGGWIGVEPLRR